METKFSSISPAFLLFGWLNVCCCFNIFSFFVNAWLFSAQLLDFIITYKMWCSELNPVLGVWFQQWGRGRAFATFRSDVTLVVIEFRYAFFGCWSTQIYMTANLCLTKTPKMCLLVQFLLCIDVFHMAYLSLFNVIRSTIMLACQHLHQALILVSTLALHFSFLVCGHVFHRCVQVADTIGKRNRELCGSLLDGHLLLDNISIWGQKINTCVARVGCRSP